MEGAAVMLDLGIGMRGERWARRPKVYIRVYVYIKNRPWLDKLDMDPERVKRRWETPPRAESKRTDGGMGRRCPDLSLTAHGSG